MTTRQVLVEKVQQQLDDLDRELQRLELKADKASEDVRHQWQRHKLALIEQRQQLMARLEEAQSVADSHWEHVKQSLLDARQEFAQAIQDIRRTLGR